MTVLGRIRVPNVFPLQPAPYRIAVIGEALGEHEERKGEPFVGPSGGFLNSLLAGAGMDRDACFVGNICQYRPPGNVFTKFDWFGEEVQEGLLQLTQDLDRFKPNLCLLLGGVPLHAARASKVPYRPSKNPFPISDYRGSLFVSDDIYSPFFGRKCMATYHPAFLLRIYDHQLIVRFDMRRAEMEGKSPELQLKERNFILEPDLAFIIQQLDEIKKYKTPFAFDIEGGVGTMSCLSIATSPQFCFVIPFVKQDGSSYWAELAEVLLWEKLASVFEDTTIPKYVQNYLYDGFVLPYSYRMPVRGLRDDIMLRHWEFLCPFAKDLGFQASLYTKQPFYKYQRKTDDLKTFWQYNCTDSAVTFECNEAQAKLVQGSSDHHYRFNMSMQQPVLYMQLRGMRFDQQKREARIAELEVQQRQLQTEVNDMSGMDLNVKSVPQVKHYLYEVLKLPIQRKRAKTGEDEGAVTTDFEAMLNLLYKHETPGLRKLIDLRRVRDRISRLKFKVDPDGRVRCGYIIPGSETGRITCHTSSTGSGTNLQTITEDDRDLFPADEGYEFGQADLAGADGWTVAAYCASLGDPTMLEDLLAGLKIPKILALMVKEGPQISHLDRPALLKRTKEVDKKDPIYFSSKVCQHGSNYGMAPKTVAKKIFNDSEGQIVFSTKEAEKFQNAYFYRYRGIPKWHSWYQNHIQKGKIVSASGHVRPVTGRKDSQDTVRQLLAHEPQNNTTWATNRAVLNLWRDPDNRPLIAQPLHQVHDALCEQHPIAYHDWLVEKMAKWFDNTIVIAGIPIKIPYELTIGKNWKGEQ